MYFEIISEISEIEPIAVGAQIRDLKRLRKQFGPGRWRKFEGIAHVKFESGRIRRVELHWYQAHGIGKRKIRYEALFGLSMKDMGKEPRFVVCVNNDDCEDLEVRKIYQMIPDEAAAADGLLRVVDEWEDYLYPTELFLQIELPQAVEKALLPAA